MGEYLFQNRLYLCSLITGASRLKSNFANGGGMSVFNAGTCNGGLKADSLVRHIPFSPLDSANGTCLFDIAIAAKRPRGEWWRRHRV